MTEQNDLDLMAIIKILLGKKVFIISLTFLFAILSVVYALSLPNKYQAISVIAPIEQTDNQSTGFTPFSSLGGLMFSGGSSRAQETIEIAKSFALFESLLRSDESLKIDIFAAESWDQKTNKIKIDKDIYDLNSEKWVRDVKFPKTSEPSNLEAYQVFRNNYSVDQDRETGFVTIAYSHFSPEKAAYVIESILEATDGLIRNKEKLSAKQSIDYLKQQISITQAPQIKEALASLIRSQTQTIMMAEANQDYLFKVLEPVYIPEIKSEPNRPLICIIVTLFGFIISCLVVLIRFSVDKKN